MLVLTNLDLNKNQLIQPRVHNVTPAPSSPVAGQLYYDTSTNKLYYYNGSTWVDCTGGTGGPPTGAAGGDLAGSTYPNPVLATGVVTSAKIADGTITDTDVAAANKDGAVGVASLRTIGVGAQQAMAGSTRLDQIAIPTSFINFNNQALINAPDPSGATDVANKRYADNVAQGLDAKQSVRAATTANLANFATTAPNTLDGVTLQYLDRVLVKDQTTQYTNGIYVVQTVGTGANGSWVNASDFDTWAEVPSAFVWVEQGTVNKDTGWVCTADQGGTFGTTAITWVQFSGAGQITDGIGLLKTGNTLDVRLDGTTVEAPADIVQVKDLGITGAKIANATIDPNTKLLTAVPVSAGGTGAGSAGTARLGLIAAGYYSSATHSAGTTIGITAGIHGLRGTRGLIVQCRLEATGEEIIADSLVAANGDVTVTFAASQGANTVRVTIVG